MSIELRQIPGEPIGFYEAVAEPVTHIPANDWATVGARLERCGEFKVDKDEFTRWFYATILWGNRFFTERGATPLEALTAALDAAEGKS